MDPIPVVVRHQGKKYDVELDLSSTGETFKMQMFSLTGVEPERQKILIKGSQLKDDADMGALGIKPGHSFMMMGTPLDTTGVGVIERPKEPIRFLEDMTEAELAKSESAVPVGLTNLGNTCYMNAALQIFRFIPELQLELSKYKSQPLVPSSSDSIVYPALEITDIVASMRDLFKRMSETQEAFAPHAFLSMLRQVFPQFSQKTPDNRGYAQQDAEEAWSQMLTQIRSKLKTTDQFKDDKDKTTSWLNKFMTGKLQSVMEVDEQLEGEQEKSVVSTDDFYKLNCHITAETNHLRDGLLTGLTEKIEKKSDTLNREATYSKTSRITHLPVYLPVHFMRFDWRRTTGKKAKIMRKVVFPKELDVVEFCGDDLKSKLIPIRDKIREIRKEEEEVERSRKRWKRAKLEEEENAVQMGLPRPDQKPPSDSADHDQTLAEKNPNTTNSQSNKLSLNSNSDELIKYKTDDEIKAEKISAIVREKKELFKMLEDQKSPELLNNPTGLYELRSVLTHQGANADSGHYTAFVKRTGTKDAKTGKIQPEDGTWWWFNDEKLSIVTSDTIDTLSGGGQNHAALLLLYRAIPIPEITDEELSMVQSSGSNTTEANSIVPESADSNAHSTD